VKTASAQKYLLLAGVALIIAAVAFWVGLARNDRINGEKTIKTMLALASEIERIDADRGRLPYDEQDLARLTAKVLPKSAWGTQLKYVKVEGGFLIDAYAPTDWRSYEYDSRKRAAGVQVSAF
jgi:hypothetical protein